MEPGHVGASAGACRMRVAGKRAAPGAAPARPGAAGGGAGGRGRAPWGAHRPLRGAAGAVARPNRAAARPAGGRAPAARCPREGTGAGGSKNGVSAPQTTRQGPRRCPEGAAQGPWPRLRRHFAGPTQACGGPRRQARGGGRAAAVACRRGGGLGPCGGRFRAGRQLRRAGRYQTREFAQFPTRPITRGRRGFRKRPGRQIGNCDLMIASFVAPESWEDRCRAHGP